MEMKSEIKTCAASHEMLLESQFVCSSYQKKNVLVMMMIESLHQRWNRGHHRLEAKAKDIKKSEAKAKTKDRPSRGQGQECSSPRPRTNKDKGTSALQKKVFRIFSGDLQKKGLRKIFQAIYKILTIQKIGLSSSRVQGNF